MKLRTRFALFSSILTMMIMGGASTATLHFLKALVLKEIESSQATVAQNLKKVCEESIISRDDILAYNYIDSLGKTVKGLAYASFVNTQRGLILGKNDMFVQAVGSDETVLSKKETNQRDTHTVSGGRKVLGYSSNVSLNGQNVGNVYLGFFQDKVEENIRESVSKITTIIFYVSIVAFVIGLMISLLFAVQLTRPINQLAKGAQDIGEGNLDTQIKIERKDEIGFLAKEFNIMAVKLKELDQLKDAFVSSVSHELRSPLTAISGYVELLTLKPIQEANPEKVNKALNIIQESTTRLTHFVNDILDVAKIKAGKMEMNKTNFNVRLTAESVFSLFHPLFEKKKIVAKFDVSPQVPVVAADNEKIRQVITNLLSNAYKFTKEGGSITLAAQSNSDWVTISVQDTGVGIAKEHQGLIFGKFQQVPGSKETMAGPKGTGLGLAIAKGIVEAHGGQMKFESEPGKGTTFYFSLPVKATTGQEVVQAKKLA